jgi:hypothetical protein
LFPTLNRVSVVSVKFLIYVAGFILKICSSRFHAVPVVSFVAVNQKYRVFWMKNVRFLWLARKSPGSVKIHYVTLTLYQEVFGRTASVQCIPNGTYVLLLRIRPHWPWDLEHHLATLAPEKSAVY